MTHEFKSGDVCKYKKRFTVVLCYNDSVTKIWHVHSFYGPIKTYFHTTEKHLTYLPEETLEHKLIK